MKSLAGDFADVPVDVVGIDATHVASLVDVLKQLVTRQVLAFSDDSRQPAVGEFHGVILPALAAELEVEFGAFNAHVAIAHCGEAEGFVIPCVLVIANANKSSFQEADHGGQHFLFGQSAARQIFGDALPDQGQHGAEGHHAAELRLIAHLAILGVVAILLPPARVPAYRLHMTMGRRADPYIFPSRGNSQGPDPLQVLWVAQRLSIRTQVTEDFAMTAALYARSAARNVA